MTTFDVGPVIPPQDTTQTITVGDTITTENASRPTVASRTPAAARAALEAVSARAAAQAGAENFPVALRLLPAGPRADLAAVYRFARFVDDVGDETDTDAAGRLALLAAIAADVDLLDDGVPELAPVAGLADLTRRHRVPVDLYRDLVEANRRDQTVHRYDDWTDLLGYCALSADPIGRIVLHLADVATPANVRDSDSVCSALQVLEHCQDVGEDAAAGRVYVPAADLDGLGPSQLTAATTPPALAVAVRVQVERSRHLLAAGTPLVARLHGWARVAVAGYVAGGLATADALEAADFRVLDSAVRPSKARTARHATRLLRARALGATR